MDSTLSAQTGSACFSWQGWWLSEGKILEQVSRKVLYDEQLLIEVLGPVPSAPGNLSEMQILGPTPETMNWICKGGTQESV